MKLSKSRGFVLGLLLLLMLQLVPVLNAQEAKTIEYTLKTALGGDPAMAFVGVGGDIDGVVNPELVANVGDTIILTVVNGDPVLHDLVIDEFGRNYR
ncbi:hypothetical protein MASR2M15_29550 [Anaerolineales bacterium]